jgi:exonuclease SbcC
LIYKSDNVLFSDLMVPLKLFLENFLSYSEDVPPDRRTLDFRGFTLACLSGKNGHGKSALLDALTWALWGECRARNKEEIIRRGAKKAMVELEFDLDGNRYWVRRTITRKKGFSTSTQVEFQVFDASAGSFRTLAQDGRTQDAIERMLKMDYGSFICSSFILQGKADEFTKKTPGERKEVLGKILELEKYEELGKRSRELSQKLKLEVESAEKEISWIESEIAQKEVLEEKIKEVKADEEKVTLDLRDAEKLYEEVLRESEALRARVETYSRLVHNKSETERKCSRLREELEKLNREIERDNQFVSKEKEILQGYRELERAREEERVLSEKFMRQRDLEKKLEETNRLINDEKSKIEKKISSLTGRKKEIENRLAEIMDLLEREEEVKAGFKEFLETESLEKDFERKRETSERLKSRQREIELGIEKIRLPIEARIKEVETKIKELSQMAEESERLKEECGRLRAEIRARLEIQAMCENLKARLKEAGEEKRTLISRKSEIEKRQKEEAEKLRIIKSEADKSHCPLCESPLDKEGREALLEKIEKSLLHLKSALEEESKGIKQIEEDEKRLNNEIKVAESEIKDIPDLNKQLGQKEKSFEDSILASENLELAKIELSKKIIERENSGADLRSELEELTQEIMRTAYNEKNHKEIKQKLESLRQYQAEYRRLEEAMVSKDETENHIASIDAEIALLTKILTEGLFANQHKEEALEIERKIREIGYDEQRYRGLKSNLKNLELFSKEKEGLDKAKLNLAHNREKRENFEEQLNIQMDELKKIDAQIKDLEEVVTITEVLEERKNLIQRRVIELKKAKDEKLEEKTRVMNEIERIARLKNKKEEILEQIKKLKHNLIVYQELDKAFGKNGIQARIIEGALEEIEIEANKVLRKLTDGNMTLELDALKLTQKGSEKETLEIKISDSFGTRSYETFSGGEAFRIDFALRIAISRFIANCSGAQLRTLIIDEGFGTQDKDGLSQFVQVINAIKGDFDKVIIVTHLDELKDKFPVRIEVTKEPGRGSGFEVIYS